MRKLAREDLCFDQSCINWFSEKIFYALANSNDEETWKSTILSDQFQDILQFESFSLIRMPFAHIKTIGKTFAIKLPI